MSEELRRLDRAKGAVYSASSAGRVARYGPDSATGAVPAQPHAGGRRGGVTRCPWCAGRVRGPPNPQNRAIPALPRRLDRPSSRLTGVRDGPSATVFRCETHHARRKGEHPSPHDPRACQHFDSHRSRGPGAACPEPSSSEPFSPVGSSSRTPRAPPERVICC